MASSVQLRALTRGERRVLQVAEVADRVGCNVTMVYEWVHRFNESGSTTFEQPPNPKARLPIITGRQIRELIDIALSSPTEQGLPFSAWTVPKMAAYCRQRGLLPPINGEWVRRLLRREGLRAQRIRTWKTSDDPAFDRKKNASASSTGRWRRCGPDLEGDRVLVCTGARSLKAGNTNRVVARRLDADFKATSRVSHKYTRRPFPFGQNPAEGVVLMTEGERARRSVTPFTRTPA